MPNLKEYIKQNLSKGYSKEQIKDQLLKTGWQKNQIDSAIYSVAFEQNQFKERVLIQHDFLKKFVKFLKKVIVIIIMLSIIPSLFYFTYQFINRPKNSIINTLKIRGGSDCVAKVNNSLDLLSTHWNEYFKEIENNVSEIRCSATATRPNFECEFGKNCKYFTINEKSLDQDSTTLSAIITHETCHVKQFLYIEQNRNSWNQSELEKEQARNLEHECYEVSNEAFAKLNGDNTDRNSLTNIDN